MALLFSGKFSLSPDVISEHMLGETLLMNTQTLVYIRLDSLAGSLWRLLERHETIEDVYTGMKAAHDMPRERMEEFMNGCLSGFRRAGLISLEAGREESG